MTFEEAIKKSIKAYLDMEDDSELEIHKNSKEHIYNKKYFDKFEEERKESRNGNR